MTPSDAPATLAALPEWWPEAMLWLGVAALAAIVAAALGAWAVARHLEHLRGELRVLETLGEIQRTLAHWLGERDDLDLRRVEHLLIDLRDGSKRLEDLLLRGAEQRSAESGTLLPATPPSVGERVVNRLVALGYERVELVTPHEELESFGTLGGDVLVEARRDGVLCKGRVRIRAGRIDSAELQPAFHLFP